METFGTRLAAARKEAKLTQEQLGSKVGLSQTTISDIERGRNHGSTEGAALASALGVAPLWLSTGRGPKYPSSLTESGDYAACQPGHESVMAVSTNHLPTQSPIRSELPVRCIAEHRDQGAIRLVQLENASTVPALALDPLAYGIRVKGLWAEPRVKHGETLVIEPGSAAVAGDDVLAELKNGSTYLVRILTIRGDSYTLAPLGQDRAILVADHADFAHLAPVTAILRAAT